MQFELAVVLFNPKSTGESERNARRLGRRLVRAKVAEVVQVIATTHAGHAEELVVELAEQHASLLAVSSSGDGGYNELINGALKARRKGHRVVTGLLPSGNANDHYKALHKPYVIRRLKAGQLQSVDVLKVQTTIKGKSWERYAHSYIGFGITSKIGKALNETDLTPTKEILVTAKAFLEFEAFEAVVDKKQQMFQSIIVSNVGKMSKFFKMSKSARVDDGKFEVITAEADKAKLLSTMVKSATVGVPHEKQAKTFSFRTVGALPVQLDGEVFTIDADSLVTVTVGHNELTCII